METIETTLRTKNPETQSRGRLGGPIWPIERFLREVELPGAGTAWLGVS